MAKVFISYRREDTADFWAEKIVRYLSSEFGAQHFFKDTESIKTGSNWQEVLNKELEAAAVVVILIGPDFFTLVGKSGKPRIQERNDIVRAEIRDAIRLGKVIIPVLLPQAKFPANISLPSDIQNLLKIEVFNIKKATDINRLIVKLEHYIPGGALYDAATAGHLFNKGYESADEICARASTEVVAKLIELGWYLMLNNKNLVLLHSKILSFRFSIKIKLAAIILEQKSKNIWGQQRWKPKAFFNAPTVRSSLDIALDLREAAINPAKYLKKKGGDSIQKIRGYLRRRAKKSFKESIVYSARSFSPESSLKTLELLSGGLKTNSRKFGKEHNLSFIKGQPQVKEARRAASETVRLKELNRLMTGFQHKWLSFHPNDTILAVGGAENYIQIWNLDQHGNDVSMNQLNGHRDTTNSGSFSAHGLLATTSDDGTVRVWDVKKKKQLRKFQLYGILRRLVRLSFCPVHCVDWSSDGNLLAAVAEQNKILLWNSGSWASLPSIKMNGSMVRFNPKNGQIASDGFPEHFGIYDRTIRKWIHKISHPYPGFIKELDFSPDGKILAAGGNRATILLYDAATGQHIKTLEGHDTISEPGSNSIRSIRFSPNGRWLASTSSDNYLIIWDMKTMALSTTYEYETWLFLVGEGIPGLAWSCDSLWLALPSVAGEIQILEVKERSLLR